MATLTPLQDTAYVLPENISRIHGLAIAGMCNMFITLKQHLSIGDHNYFAFQGLYSSRLNISSEFDNSGRVYRGYLQNDEEKLQIMAFETVQNKRKSIKLSASPN